MKNLSRPFETALSKLRDKGERECAQQARMRTLANSRYA
jgi:hypothetical protein